MADIKISGKSITTVVDEVVVESNPTKLSEIENDSAYVTTSGHVKSAKTATSATTVSNTSGVSAGSYGQGGSVTITQTKTGSVKIPYFTVNAQGLVTSMGYRTLTVTAGCKRCTNCSQCNKTSGCSQTSGCSHSCSRCSHCGDCNCEP